METIGIIGIIVRVPFLIFQIIQDGTFALHGT